jgi:peptidoglycan/LPS O-acetylase OafA/YrhL
MLNVEPAEPLTTAVQRVTSVGTYRPDIDGLRALAIVSVVAYHVGIRALHGGFVGVDIFFVVSGYLIGGIVYNEAKCKTFTFAKFYQRRAKRILPVFFAVLLSCYSVAMLVLSPDELRRFAATALASIFSASNIHLWLTTGYFTKGAQFDPLLMTWSLAVEEQFYILLPVVLLAVLNYKRHLVIHAIALFSVLSFVLSMWAVAHHPTMAFFLLPTRAWEIGVGVLLAIYANERPIAATGKPNRAVHVWGGLGAALLVCSILVSRSTQFPGVAALIPVVGTLLIIGTRNSFTSGILSTRPAVFVGKLSYSWYLWHWPMLSFARIVSDRPLGLGVTLSIAWVSFLVAIASFYLVEEPFRHSQTPARRMLIQYGTLLLTISMPPLVLFAMRGFPQRRAELAEMEAQGVNVAQDACLAPYGKTGPRLTPDCIAASNDQRIVALIGDSHAASLAATLRSIAVRSGYAFEELGKASCPPLQSITIYMPNHPGHDRECAAFNLQTLSYLRSNPRIDIVVIAAFWSGPLSQPEENFGYVPTLGSHTEVSYEVSLKNLQRGLENEVQQLRASGKRVVLMKDAPDLSFNPVQYEIARFIPLRRNLKELISPPPGPEYASGRASAYDDCQESAIVDSIAAKYSDVRVYDLKKRLCEGGGCAFLSHGSLLYVDSNHLSQAGAEATLAGLDLDGKTKKITHP